jgi:hypothetical protein
MPNNYVLLETIQLTASAASVVFDNLPTSGYTDLKVVMSARSASATDRDQLNINFNGLTTNQTYRILYGIPSVATGSETGSKIRVGYISGNNSTANTYGNCEAYIPNYLSSNFKSVSADGVGETNASPAGAQLGASLWSSTAAITSIAIVTDSGSNFLANSTFSLYGIAAFGTTPVLAPKATGGNSIENDGTYWIHTFTSSGVFTPQTNLTCDYLVVAGGGGGGYAGGGAGGYRSGSSFSVASGVLQNVTIGAGGAGGASGTVAPGTSGSDSIFSSITSTAGGGGGGANGSPNQDGKNGGSGGGAGYSSIGGSPTFGTGNTPSTSPSQGNNGGTSLGATGIGGGGGAGAVGGNGAALASGAGGAGTASSISGTSVTRAGGGGGGGGTGVSAGAGGSGGGGAGSQTGNATSGTVNTGGGGGGGNYSSTPNLGGTGGSGIVIVRYPIA